MNKQVRTIINNFQKFCESKPNFRIEYSVVGFITTLKFYHLEVLKMEYILTTNVTESLIINVILIGDKKGIVGEHSNQSNSLKCFDMPIDSISNVEHGDSFSQFTVKLKDYSNLFGLIY